MKRVVACLVFWCLVSGLAYAAEPTEAARALDAKKACRSNMLMLLGAVEMYNLDHPTPITELNPELIRSLLIAGDYLKTVPECLDKGGYDISGDLAKDGRIVCSVHGDVQAIAASLAGDQASGASPDDMAQTGDPKKACLANIRTLFGAIEMYNMDSKVPVTEVNPETMGLLQKGMYLKAEPVCPAKGTYSSSGDLTKNGKITCSAHGSLPE